MNLLTTYKKLLATLLIVALLSTNVAPVLAEDAPVASTENAPVAQVASAPQPQSPSAPQAPKAPVTTPVPTQAPASPEKPAEPLKPGETPAPTPSPSQSSTAEQAATTNAAGTASNGNSGNTTVATGNTTNSATVSTNANTNTSGGNTNCSACANDDSSAANTGNGTGSNNSSNSNSATADNSAQNNTATVGNSLTLDTDSGNNSASYNMGDSTVRAGDANTSGTAITAVNSNIDGVQVAEFNVSDDYKGDIVLTPDNVASHCISGCGGNGSASNTNNGAGSTNNATNNDSTTRNSSQANSANIGSDLDLSANSGNNDASFNTSGDSTIITGNANVNANSLTFANNNMEGGNVQYITVNLYDDYEGDIIIPNELVTNTEGESAQMSKNTGNGAGSTNTANNNDSTSSNSSQANNASITNNLVFDANTGDNSTSENTSGNSTTTTGEANVKATTLNVANSNVDSGKTWWLVLVNKAGKWVGKLVGSEDGATMAGSEGTEFEVDENGQVTATNNSGNGAGSTNTANNNSTTTENSSQTNDATVVNNLKLSANTGHNTANANTGGGSVVKTGNANIVANLVNFVNNNIKGGKLVVTVVNVFKTFTGDIITPGQKKQDKNIQQAAATNTQTATTANHVPSVTPTATPELANAVVPTNSVPYQGVYTSTATADAKVLAAANKNEVSVQVLGESTGVDGMFANTKSLTINLAWFILLLPVIALAVIGKKVVLPRLSRGK